MLGVGVEFVHLPIGSPKAAPTKDRYSNRRLTFSLISARNNAQTRRCASLRLTWGKVDSKGDASARVSAYMSQLLRIPR
jgi:hypothetical protein